MSESVQGHFRDESFQAIDCTGTDILIGLINAAEVNRP